MQTKQSKNDNGDESRSSSYNSSAFAENLAFPFSLNPKYLKAIKTALRSELNQIFGYHALLYEPIAQYLCDDQLVIKNQLLLSQDLAALRKQQSRLSKESLAKTKAGRATVICDFSLLPVAADSIDLVVLANTLQNTLRPQQLLREAERVLIPEGVVIIIGRNPFSFTGINNLLRQQTSKLSGFFASPFNAKTKEDKQGTVSVTNTLKTDLSRKRIADWFSLLGIDKQKQINVSLSNQRVQSSHIYPWLKKCAQLFCDCFCSHYIIIGVKKVSTLTPIRPSWRSNKQLVPPRLAEPSVKTQVEHWFNKIKQNH
jgi:SAM-dependent methyltransferase